MDKLIKNIEHKTVLKIKDEVTYQKGQIVSKTLSQNEHHSLTLFAFDKGEEISTHESGGLLLLPISEAFRGYLQESSRKLSESARWQPVDLEQC